MSLEKEVLDYHRLPKPGKIEVTPTKPCRTAEELSLAHLPGSRIPTSQLRQDPDQSYQLTARRNLIALVSNGSCLSDLGRGSALSAKPLLEGRAILFKRMAGLDCFDLELDLEEVDALASCVRAFATGFGGIDLVGMTPETSWELESELSKTLEVPVFDSERWGQAIWIGALLSNACRLLEWNFEDLEVFRVGAEAGAPWLEKTLEFLGHPESLRAQVGDLEALPAALSARSGQGPLVLCFDQDQDVPAELFGGLPSEGILISLRRPGPEVTRACLEEARPGWIYASSASGTDNPIRFDLGFPYLFRGALDVGAKKLSPGMVRECVAAIARLARRNVPPEVIQAYDGQDLGWSPSYLLPRPLDPRILTHLAWGIAQAAIQDEVHRFEITDGLAYRNQLEGKFGVRIPLLRRVKQMARKNPQRIVFPEGRSPLVLQAVDRILEEGFARPILIGNEEEIEAAKAELGLDFRCPVRDPVQDPERDAFAEVLFGIRGRRGGSLYGSREQVKLANTFASLMLREGEADAMISGAETSFPETFRPAFQIIGMQPGVARVSGIHMVTLRGKLFFFADTSVQIDPKAEELVEIALQTAELCRSFGLAPRVAMLSYSSFGSVVHAETAKVRRATKLLRERAPDLTVEGEIAPDVALSSEVVRSHFPQSLIQGDANVLVFPDLSSGNLAYKMVEQLADAKVVGPLLAGFSKPVCCLPQGATTDNIVHMAAIMAIAAVGEEPTPGPGVDWIGWRRLSSG